MNILNLIINFIVLSLVSILVFQYTKPTRDFVYFATTEDGRLHQLTALSQSELESKDIQKNTVLALNALLNFNKEDYKIKLEAASQNFTKRGWESFTKWLQNLKMSNNAENEIFLNFTLLAEPNVHSPSLIADRLNWEVETPIKLTSNFYNGEYTVLVTWVRTPRLENLNGIGIEQIKFTRKQ